MSAKNTLAVPEGGATARGVKTDASLQRHSCGL